MDWTGQTSLAWRTRLRLSSRGKVANSYLIWRRAERE
jgi:hypothetical protein